MAHFKDFKVAVLALDGFEEAELTEPVKALKEAGADVDIVSAREGRIQAFKHADRGLLVDVNRTFNDVQPGEYDAVVLPGGVFNSDSIRMADRAQYMVRCMQDAKKPIAVICHGAWLLVSANLVKGRRMTSYYTIQDDIKNAGGNWVDEEVVVDHNLVSSRNPGDLMAFNREMIRVFSEYQRRRNREAA